MTIEAQAPATPSNVRPSASSAELPELIAAARRLLGDPARRTEVESLFDRIDHALDHLIRGAPTMLSQERPLIGRWSARMPSGIEFRANRAA
jgi:hypothetical protein